MTTEKLTHVPLHAPRSFQHFMGEYAFHDEWQALMAAPRNPNTIEGEDDERTGNLGLVLAWFPARLTDRHSRVAASFIRWLGTNVGSQVVNEPRRGKDGARTHQAQWHHANRRLAFVNGGWRSSDYLTSDDWSKPALCRDALDLEVLDLMAAWLDTEPGKSFVRRAEARLLAYQRGLRDGEFAITKDYQVILLAQVQP